MHNYQEDMIYKSSGKFEILDRIVPKIIGTGHKILVFSQFKKLIDVMCHFFAYRRINYLVLEGSMSHE
jgi:ATP-dependent helicase STH1/SNF2